MTSRAGLMLLARACCIQEPHKVFTLMIVKRERATDEKQVALLKIVLLGSPAELENPASDVCKFRAEVDQSRYTLTQYLERKYLRETDINCKLNDSALRCAPPCARFSRHDLQPCLQSPSSLTPRILLRLLLCLLSRRVIILDVQSNHTCYNVFCCFSVGMQGA